MSLTSIIIPSYNEQDFLQECIYSIKQHTTTPYEIIVVDNGSIDGTLDYSQREDITLISLPHNVGFPTACNLGLSIACGDALLLLNNDVQVSQNWLTNMLKCLYSSHDIGVVGPTTNYASGKQQVNIPFTNLADMAAELNQPDPRKWEKVDRIVGLCFLFRRELMDQIGLLDEQFSPGHYEDDDFCYRAKQAGYQNMLAGDVFIYHQGSVSFAKQGEAYVEQLLKTNRQKFFNKWGIHPDEVNT